ncbi:glutathione S-transferase [Piromyces finnis]|uniref:Glutathione S-transferase n=1 Tax=Piromyces finnis TaxID=1754191 RepID=A0A1Y1VFX8_9FUNG|nr:glutathione S-transferase [Piromyces finnis]|eukprot:ORX55259.1 glutathione S-transferase [Piromyces finnis]
MADECTYDIYFYKFRGRAEPIRLLLEYVGAKYKNLHPIDWPSDFKSKIPFGNLPVIVEKDNKGNEFRLVNPQTIIRYIANKYKLSGSNLHETALMDTVGHSYIEAYEQFIKAWSQPNPIKKELLEKYFTNELAQFIQYHEGFLSDNKCQNFYFGEKMSYVDILCFHFMDRLLEVRRDVFVPAKCPHLWNIYENVRKNPKIQDYLFSPRRLPLSLNDRQTGRTC